MSQRMKFLFATQKNKWDTSYVSSEKTLENKFIVNYKTHFAHQSYFILLEFRKLNLQ